MGNLSRKWTFTYEPLNIWNDMTTDAQDKADRWDFDNTRMSTRDLNTCLFFAHHGCFPKEDEVDDEPIDLEFYGTGKELPLVELAALYAHGVLWYTGFGDFGGGRLPDSVDANVYDGQNHDGFGLCLEASYVDNGLKELAPILIKYNFFK